MHSIFIVWRLGVILAICLYIIGKAKNHSLKRITIPQAIVLAALAILLFHPLSGTHAWITLATSCLIILVL